jgi:Fe-S cluster biosynthesis and repair protein YggX
MESAIMPSAEERIAQFRQVVAANPEDGMSQFSLGKALLDAGQSTEAIRSFERALELKLDPSRLYQLLGSALLKEGKKDAAITRLTQGVKLAATRGDFMPRDEMVKMLQDLGATIPQEAQRAAAPQAVGEGTVHCTRCGKDAPRMPTPPFNNAQGRMIQEHACVDCWREWVRMGTNIINHMHLPLNDPRAQKMFDEKMYEFLNLPPQS